MAPLINNESYKKLSFLQQLKIQMYFAFQVGQALPKDINEHDIDCFLKLYDNLRLKANMPTEVIEDIDKNLIQV